MLKNLAGNFVYIITVYRDINSSERTSVRPVYFDQPVDSKFDLEEISSGYKDKRDEMALSLESLAKEIPNKKAHMLESKEEYHRKIDEAVRL